MPIPLADNATAAAANSHRIQPILSQGAIGILSVAQSRNRESDRCSWRSSLLRNYFFAFGILGRTVVPVGGNGGSCVAKRLASTSPQVLRPPKRLYMSGGTRSFGSC